MDEETPGPGDAEGHVVSCCRGHGITRTWTHIHYPGEMVQLCTRNRHRNTATLQCGSSWEQVPSHSLEPGPWLENHLLLERSPWMKCPGSKQDSGTKHADPQPGKPKHRRGPWAPRHLPPCGGFLVKPSVSLALTAVLMTGRFSPCCYYSNIITTGNICC